MGFDIAARQGALRKAQGRDHEAELHEYLTSRKFALTPRTPKNDPRPDRLETEAYKAMRDLEDAKTEIDRLCEENRSLKSQVADLVLRVGTYIRHRLGFTPAKGRDRFLLEQVQLGLQAHETGELLARTVAGEDAFDRNAPALSLGPKR